MKRLIAVLVLLAASASAQTITYVAAGSGSAIQASGTVATVSALTWVEGDLIVAFASGCSATNPSCVGVTVTCADSKSNSWSNPVTNAGYQSTALWQTVGCYTVVATGKGGSGISFTATSTKTSDYIDTVVMAFHSTTGWPATPIDQSVTTAVSLTGTPLSVTAGSQNASAVSLVAVQGGVTTGPFSSPTAGYTTQFNIDSNAFDAWWKVTSGLETSSFGVTASSNAGAAELVMMTFTPNAGATTEQTHFRFRNDDGSETTATWLGAEDAAITETLATPRRLRLQVDTVGDLASSALQLEWMKSDGTDWRPVLATTQTGTITVPIMLNTDDAMQVGTAMTTTGTVLGASLDVTTEWVGLRFQNVNLPKGATITSAYISVVPSASTEDEPLVTLFVEDADSSATFTTGASNIAGRAMTSGVAWSSSNLGADGATYFNSPDLSAQVQAVINRAGWAYGNPITVLIQGGATSTRDLTIFSYENAAAKPANLLINWIYPTPAFVLSASANIAAAAATATTAQLSVPNAHSFTAGRISDDTNPLPALDPAANNYLELEWSLMAQSPAADGDVYQFRVTVGGVPLTTYSVTPQWTIGSGGAPATVRKRVSGGWRTP